MTWTSWGSRRVLRKCLVVSVVLHVGLIAFGGQTAWGLRALGLRPLAEFDEPADREHIREIRVTPEVVPSLATNPNGNSDGLDLDTGISREGDGRATGEPRGAFDRPGETQVGDIARLSPSPDRPDPQPNALARSELAMAPIAPPADVPEITPPRRDALVDRPIIEPEPEPEIDTAPVPPPAEITDLPEVAEAGPTTPAVDPISALRAGSDPTFQPLRPSEPANLVPPSRDLGTRDNDPVAVVSPRLALPSSVPITDNRGPATVSEPNRPELMMPSLDRVGTADLLGGVTGPVRPGPSDDVNGDDLPVVSELPAREPAPPLAMPGDSSRDVRGSLAMPAAPRLGPSNRPSDRAPIAVARNVPSPTLPRFDVTRPPPSPRRLPDVPEVYRPRLDPNRSQRAQQAGASPASEEAVEQAPRLARPTPGRRRPLGRRHRVRRRRRSPGRRRRLHRPLPARRDLLRRVLLLGGRHRHDRPGPAGLPRRRLHPPATASTPQTVGKGLTFLLAIQKPDGDLRGRSRAVGMYCHAMATLALCEAYALTGDSALRGPRRTGRGS